MISNGLDTTNFWLGTIAIVSVLQLLLFGAAAWTAYRLYNRAMTVLGELEARHLAPVTARVNYVLDEVQEMTTRIRDAEGMVRHKVKLVAETGVYVVAAMRARTWAIVGLARGVRAGLAVLFGPGMTRTESPPRRAMRTRAASLSTTAQGGPVVS